MKTSARKLGDLLVPVQSVSPAISFGGSDFTYVDISSVDRERKRIREPQIIPALEAPSRARQLLMEGDVLVSTVRPNLNTVAAVDSDFNDAIASTGFCVLRTDSTLLNSRFLFHWVSSTQTVSRLVNLATGATYPAVSDKIIKSLTIQLPSLDGQKRIAAILDKVDSVICKRHQAIRFADDFLRAVFIDMFGDPERNPKDFPVGTVRDLVSSANYGTSEKANETSGRLPILRMNNITYAGGWDLSSLKYVDLDERTQDKYMAVKGDLLFNRTNSKELVGKTAVYDREEPMAIAGYLVRVRMNEHGNPHYVSGYLNSVHGKKTLQGRAKSIVGMANINAQEMQDIPLLLPPVALQEKYALIVQSTNERLKKFHIFSQEADALHAALSQRFFGAVETVEDASC